MKKLYVLFLLFLVTPAFGYYTETLPQQCGMGVSKMGAKFDINTYDCASGTYLPANTEGCQACPNNATCSGGTFTFNPTISQGVQRNQYITQTMTDSCSRGYSKMGAKFDINQYTCSAGQFLPAYTLGCVSCPSGYTCSGGTFDFNPSVAQGLTQTTYLRTQDENNTCATNFPTKFGALFEPNNHTCVAGTYLPANTDSCTTCPANSYCPGGTYTFNETTNQGINACDTGLTSPAGSSSVSDCVTSKIQCTSGQYLPANADACVACPTGYTCAGGAFDMDNIDQGLVANNISITWKNEDGTTLTTNTCTYGQPITIPANPTKTGYTFNGWTVVSR